MPTYVGEFEQLVLLAIVKLDQEATGAAIRATIAEASGRTVWIGAVHTTLDRLVAKGLIRARLVAPADPFSRPRKAFGLAPAGRAAIGHAYSTWVRMTRGLKPKLVSS